MKGLPVWTYQPEEGFGNLTQLYTGVVNQFEYYVGHVLTNIGGIYETPKTAGQSGPVYQAVPMMKQREAMDFLSRNVLNTPKWLLDTAILARTGESPTQTISQLHAMVLNHLLSPSTLSKLAVSEAMYGPAAYQLVQYFADIDNAMWTELRTGMPVDIYRRNLQRSYLERLIELSNKSGKDYRDVGPILKAKLNDIYRTLKKAASKTKDPITEYHLRFMMERLDPIVKN